MTLRQLAFYDHRNVIFISLATVTSALAVRPDSTLLPLVATLSILLVYSPFLFRSYQANRSLNILLTWISLSIGSPLSRLHASLEALSTPGGSIVALFASSAILSSVTLATLWAATKFHAQSTSAWGQITLFPALWATVWCTVSYLNPVGHLATWSAANNTDAYSWIIPYFGPTSTDWITGAWAVVISQSVGSWYIGLQDPEDDEDDLLHPQLNHNKPPANNINATKLLALFLILLTIPSFLLPNLPLPASLSTVDISTPLTVGCILPSYQRYKRHVLTFEDYMAETVTIASRAKIILWPEGAVVFHSAKERDEAFEKVQNISQKVYIGISFEEVISDPSDPTGRQSLMQTGLAVVSSFSDKLHHIYYKRHLVPVAESYRLRHSTLPPTISDLHLPRPKYVKPEDWAPTPNNSRTVPITSSICLDFAAPSPFAELDSRPALILAPARTWDITVGYAMWLQAKQRAEELGTMVLWCDGGEGGVSGVAGNGYGEVTQVGSGTWVRTIGVQYPFDTRQTLFARFGDLVLILFWVSAVGPGLLGRTISTGGHGSIRRRIYSAIQWMRPRQSAQPNLVDL